jgi:hypothetical protein
LGQFIAMLFCQLGDAKSLREICGGLAASEGKLRHLGLSEAPARSTLAYANFYQLAQAGIDAYFRRIEFYDEEHDRVLVFLTSHMELAAATIAAVYKERWQIELFFRALKQSLRVKTFVGTSAQALKTQLWTALIAILLVKYLQLKPAFGWSLSNLVSLLCQQLFVYRDLWAWIDNPFQPPPMQETLPQQLALQLS